jgi:hypothetical protein
MSPRRRRLAGATIGIALAIWAGYRVALPRYVEHRLRRALHDRGFPQAELTVARVTAREIELSAISVGPTAHARSATIGYRLRDLVRGRVDAITIEGAAFTVAMPATVAGNPVAGRVVQPDIDLDAWTERLPFRRLVLRGGRARVVGLGAAIDVSIAGEVRAGATGLAISVAGAVRDTRYAAVGALDGDGGSVRVRAAGLDGSASLARAAGGAWAIAATATLDELATNLGGALVRGRALRGEARAELSGRGLRVTSVDASAADLAIDDAGLGTATVSLRRDPAGLVAALSVRRGDGLAIDATLPAVAEPVRLPVAIAWRARGALPDSARAALRRVGVAIEAAGGVAEGHAWYHGDRRLTLRGSGSARAGRLTANGGDLRATRAEVTVEASAEIDGAAIAVEIARGRLAADHLRWGRLEAERPAIELGAGLVADDGGLRLELRRAVVAASSARVGSTIAVGRVRAGLAPGTRATLDLGAGDGRARFAAALEATAPVALAGLVDGVFERGRFDVSGEIGRGRRRVTAHVGGEATTAAIDGGAVVLADLRIRAPLAWGDGAATGDIASAVVWRGRPVGSVRASLAWTPAGPTAAGTATLPGDIPVALAASLAADAGARVAVVDVALEQRVVDLGALAATFGGVRTVTGRGSLALAGRVALGPGGPRGSLRASLAEGTVSAGALEVHGLAGEVALAGLFPPVAVGEQGLSFAGGRAGPLAVGAGSIGLILDGERTAARVAVSVGGGEVITSPIALSAAQPTSVRVTLDGVELHDVAPALTSGRVRGSGRIDGHAVAVVAPGAAAAQLESAQLHGRGGGRLALRDAGALAGAVTVTAPGAPADLDVPGLVRRRVAGALADFEYSRLAVELRRDGADLNLVADLRGIGRRVPQEVALHLRARAIHHLVRRALGLAGAPSPGSGVATPPLARGRVRSQPGSIRGLVAAAEPIEATR